MRLEVEQLIPVLLEVKDDVGSTHFWRADVTAADADLWREVVKSADAAALIRDGLKLCKRKLQHEQAKKLLVSGPSSLVVVRAPASVRLTDLLTPDGIRGATGQR